VTDGRTDRQTDGITTPKTALALLHRTVKISRKYTLYSPATFPDGYHQIQSSDNKLLVKYYNDDHNEEIVIMS